MKTDEQVKDEQDDAEMMKRPHLWPGVVLPLKRYHEGTLQTAVLIHPPAEGEVWMISLTNMFNPDPNAPAMVYDSAETIVANGWRVD